jgi:nitroreductase
MDLSQVLRRRRMVRTFAPDPLDPALVADLLEEALRAPTAGNAGGTAWLALEGPAQTATYWDHTTTGEWRRRSRRWAGLAPAPVVALSLTSPTSYLERYAENDKAGSGLGARREATADTREAVEGAWPVPYWFGDAAFATMTLLLQATDRGLAACFLGNFRGERPLLQSLAVPPTWRLFGAVLLGHAGGPDPRSRSLDRAVAPAAARVHRGHW